MMAKNKSAIGLIVIMLWILNFSTINVSAGEDIIPSFLSNSLDAYKEGGGTAFFQSIFANSVLEQNCSDFITKLISLEKDKGKYLTWEKVDGNYISSSLQGEKNFIVLRIAMKYEKAPIYLRCIGYFNGKIWILSEFKISDKVDDIFSTDNLG